MSRWVQPIVAGVVTAVVGFASSFAVVLAGLHAVGADQPQAASGLLVLCVLMGLTAIVLGFWRRMPISVAWSTPGAALLVSTGAVHGGFGAAVGAFLICGLLIVAAGLFPALGRLIAAIPSPVANAMLAGVLLNLCTAPVRALVETPLLAAPVVLIWAVLTRFARRWAVPAALVAAVVAIAVAAGTGHLTGTGSWGDLWPAAVLVAPVWSAQAIISIALPLFLVTMASQNVPGMAVLASYGYRPPLRGLLVGTGIASVAGAPFGGHAVNLAAISAALVAGPDAGPDPDRRWIGSVTAGVGYVLLGLCASAATAFVALSPPVLIEGVAGLALLGAFGAAVTAAVAQPGRREAAVVTFIVTASGVTLGGIGAAFWGLIAGGLMMLLLRHKPAMPSGAGASAAAAFPAPAGGPSATVNPDHEARSAEIMVASVVSAAPSEAPPRR